MAQRDPELNLPLAKKAYFEQHPSEGTLAVSPDQQFFIALKFTGDLGVQAQAGFTLGNSVGNIAYGVTDLAGLEALANHPQVEMIEKQRKARIQLDQSIPDIKVNQVWSRSGDHFSGYNGRNVSVGIIDTGIDFSFRRADGTTRIQSSVDQNLSVNGSGSEGEQKCCVCGFANVSRVCRRISGCRK